MKNYLEIIKNYNKFNLLKLFFIEIHRKIWREIIIGSYAQNYEDIFISRFFRKKKKGIYLEIGAYHPTRLSNTYYFYKRGWRGILVEPNPKVKQVFKKIRPRDKFINMGIAEKDGNLNYYKFLIPAINTFSKNESKKNIEKGHKLSEIIKIKTIGIKDIILKEKISQVDLLSIDTEGFDELILKNWPWDKLKPNIICVEIDKNKNVENILNKIGYKEVYRSNSNLISVRSDFLEN